MQGVQLTIVVVTDQPLGEMQQGAQLTQSAAVRLHLGGVVLGPEEGTIVVGGNVLPLVNDVDKARLQDLKDRQQRENSVNDSGAFFGGKFLATLLKPN